MPCILNAANEMAVAAFLTGKINFMQIPEVVEYTLGKESFIKDPGLDELEFCDSKARETSSGFINKLTREK